MKRSIAVGVITRRRAKRLARLLDSFARMDRPVAGSVFFIVVENDTEQMVADAVKHFTAQVSEPVIYKLEPQPGIPTARNRVLDIALDEGADVLTFVDDDEAVDQDWLTALLRGMDAQDLDLAGAPLRIAAEDGVLGWQHRSVLSHQQARAQKNAAAREAKARAGDVSGIYAFTNNWALRLSFQRATGVRFDESLQETGGSDTAFSIAVQKAGGKVGWVPDAWVTDYIPIARLGFGYTFRRARDQALNYAVLRRKSALHLAVLIVVRFLAGVLTFLALPVIGQTAPAQAVHRLGAAAGLFCGLLGRRSAHYAHANTRFHEDSGSQEPQ